MALNNSTMILFGIYAIISIELVRFLIPFIIKAKKSLIKGDYTIVASKLLKIKKEDINKEDCRNCYVSNLCNQCMDELALENFSKEDLSRRVKEGTIRGKFSRRKDKDDDIYQAYELFIIVKN